MAITAAGGWSNLPNGVFSPVIYSQKVQKAFRKSSVVEDVTNNDYFGEIANFGDSVKIIKEPEISVQTYTRGVQLTADQIEDEDFSLVIDQANYFMFKVEDVEAAFSHVNWMDLATDRAGYRLRDQYDQDVLGYLTGFKQSSLHSNADTARTASDIPGTAADDNAGNDELLAANKLLAEDFGGTTGNSIAIQAGGSGVATPLQVMNRMARLMDSNNVPREGRWFIADPVFFEELGDEDSKLMDHDYVSGDSENLLRNGRVSSGMVRGFRMYNSNNLPYVGTGPGVVATGGSTTNYGIIVAGHDSAVATASRITKTESYRDPDTFADVVRGLHLYGRKILRPEAIVTAAYNLYD